MNHRDRALAAMRGQPVDHIPFVARMELWHGFHHSRGTLPAPYEKASLWDIQRDLGIGLFGFGAWAMPYFRLDFPATEVSVDGGKTITRYQTPYGALTCRDTMAEILKEAAGSGARTEFPFKSERDYDALLYLIEHTRVVDNFDEYGPFVDAIGSDGLAVPNAGHLPAHQLMIKYMGYERFYYELNDRPAQVERLVDALTAQYRAMIDLAIRCPAVAIEVGGNYDEMMTPPPVFDRFFAPVYRETRRAFDAAGKILVVHGDGEMKTLLARLRDCGIQVVEALTPKPMTSIDIRATRRLWQGQVALWGGIASIVLTDVFSDDEFEAHLEDLFEAVAPGDHFILGYGDNVPTDALFPRIRRVAKFWAERGRYPITCRTPAQAGSSYPA